MKGEVRESEGKRVIDYGQVLSGGTAVPLESAKSRFVEGPNRGIEDIPLMRYSSHWEHADQLGGGPG